MSIKKPIKTNLNVCTKDNFNAFVNKHYSTFLYIANFYGGNEDDVQDAMIKLNGYFNININKRFNLSYIKLLIKSTVLDKYKHTRYTNTLIQFQDITSDESYEQLNNISVSLFNEVSELEEKEAFEVFFNKLSEALNSEHFTSLDKNLYKLYINTGLGIKALAKELKISNMIVQKSLTGTRRKLKALLREDFEDFKNKDFDKIVNLYKHSHTNTNLNNLL